MKKIVLIGSTGSIGRQVIGVVKNHPTEFEIIALCAGVRSDALARQAQELGVPVYVNDAQAAAIPEADLIFNAAAGFAGLSYSLAALSHGKTLALANKETLVCAGELALSEAEKHGGKIIPVDSEHSAIWQCLSFNTRAPMKRLIITASGGALRGMKREELGKVTYEQVLSHPTWKMGPKITVDSATLANKGYEVIEAHMLYGAPYSKIETVIQPTSIVHSLVEFEDGAVLAQLGYPSMEIPIQLALSYPERLKTNVPPMDFGRPFDISFEPLVRSDYPLYDLALSCGERGGLYPLAFNAADEVAVHAFLDGEVSFTDIFGIVEGAVEKTPSARADNAGILVNEDMEARIRAREIIKNIR